MITDKLGSEIKIGTKVMYPDGTRLKIGTVVSYGPKTEYAVIKTSTLAISRHVNNVIVVKKEVPISS